MSYWQRKHEDISEETVWSIDWEAAGIALQQSSTAKQIYVIKNATGHSAVGKNMTRRKERIHDQCPRCGEPGEDETHVVKCQHPDATQLWNTQLKHLTEWLRRALTDETIIYTIIANLRMWRADEPLPTEMDPNVHEVCQRAQTMIGWRSFLQGKLSLEWADQQTQYYRLLGLRRTGKRWVVALIRKLWEVSWTMWDHRNKILHQDDLHEVLGREELKEQIEEEYLRGLVDLPSEFRYMLQADEEEVLQYGIQRQKRWLESIQAARRLGRHRRTTLDPQQRTLEEWWSHPH